MASEEQLLVPGRPLSWLKAGFEAMKLMEVKGHNEVEHGLMIWDQHHVAGVDWVQQSSVEAQGAAKWAVVV